jgi:hypothetical protein
MVLLASGIANNDVRATEPVDRLGDELLAKCFFANVTDYSQGR